MKIETPQDLFRVLFEPFDESKKKTKSKGGQRGITFVEWTQYIARAWQEFPEGFCTEVRNVTTIGSVWTNADAEDGEPMVVDDRQVVLVVRVTDVATGIYHEATGAAPVGKTKEVWGGALPEAESQALRRAFAHFGLGLEMYFNDDEYWDIVGEAQDDDGLPWDENTDNEDYDPDADETEDEEAEVVPPTEAQVARLTQLVEILEDQDDDYSEWIEQAREKVADALDQKKVAGVVIRKLKIAMEEEGIEVPEDDEEDPS